MSKIIADILKKENPDKNDIIRLLKSDFKERQLLFAKAAAVKEKYVGLKTYYRGLIEFSNICTKNCYYCGIRAGNHKVQRYDISDEQLLNAVKFAYENNYGSVVFQSGERADKQFIDRIEQLLIKAKQITRGKIGITISLGEQSKETYRRWFNAGAHRYLLRIESSNEALYYKIHPKNKLHDFKTRLKALSDLQALGYQTGTGVMIGLPFQNYEHLADDLLFFKSFDVDMVGMGPYIEHSDTPLYQYRNQLLPLEERFMLTLKMIAILRIMMKDINIAAATALQAIDPVGREKALKAGANIMMPNITPTVNRENYQLYENKPCIDEGADECTNCLEARIAISGDNIGYGEWGDAPHFAKRKAKLQKV